MFAVLALAISVARAQPTNAAAPAKIGAADAEKHYNQEMIVTGKVAQVTLRPTIVFLNLDKPHPASPFTAIIRSENTNRFDNLNSLEGKPIEIRGMIKKYNDKPEIIVESPDQIKVMGMATATNTPTSN